MNEKRFTTKNIICSNYCVWDNNDKPYGNDEVVGLLNEQQATITHLEKVNGKNFAKRRLLEQDNLILRNENEQLRQEIGRLKKELDEKHFR